MTKLCIIASAVAPLNVWNTSFADSTRLPASEIAEAPSLNPLAAADAAAGSTLISSAI